MMAWILCFKARNQKDSGFITNSARPIAPVSTAAGRDEAGLTADQMRMILLSSTRKFDLVAPFMHPKRPNLLLT